MRSSARGGRLAAPGDMEPGGRLYRVMVLVPMQERHRDIERVAFAAGFALLFLTLFVGVALKGSGFGFFAAILTMAPVILFFFVLYVWLHWTDGKRDRLGREHDRLVARHGTQEVPWSPDGIWSGGGAE